MYMNNSSASRLRMACTCIAAILFLGHLSTASIVTNTKCGPVQGEQVDGALSFRGIPYASPPTGKLRWWPPVALAPGTGNCWNGTFNATSFGNDCFQRNLFNTSTTTGSEDCLYLNVFTPTIDPNARKPVMVWIHEGCLLHLNGHWPLSSPSAKLARDTDVVYVSFNYRLGALGFMALQMLADECPTQASGNYGFMDMLIALEWVKENIKHFGGDHHQVTVFGHGSGATAIFALLASPFSINLFNRAWLSSPSPVLNKTAGDAYQDNLVFLNATGCSDVACLRALTPKEVTSAVPWDAYPYWAMEDQGDLPTKGFFDGAIAVVDGYVLPWPPLTSWKSGFALDTTLLIGSCANEIDFNPTNNTINNWSWADYTKEVNSKLGTFRDDIAQSALKLYPPGVVSPEYQYTSMASDVRANCPTDVLALTASQHFIHPIYRYVVTSKPSVPVHAYGIPFPAKYSFHGWDMFAFFGTISGYIPNPTAEDLAFQKHVQDEVLSFVRDGRPKTQTWLPFPKTTALFSNRTNISTAFHATQCAFWTENGFFSYAWIN